MPLKLFFIGNFLPPKQRTYKEKLYIPELLLRARKGAVSLVLVSLCVFGVRDHDR